MEEARYEALLLGVEEERETDIIRSQNQLFGSLEQSDGGSLERGPLTKVRLDLYDDLCRRILPYVEWKKKDEGSNPEEERKKFLESYQKLAAQQKK